MRKTILLSVALFLTHHAATMCSAGAPADAKANMVAILRYRDCLKRCTASWHKWTRPLCMTDDVSKKLEDIESTCINTCVPIYDLHLESFGIKVVKATDSEPANK